MEVWKWILEVSLLGVFVAGALPLEEDAVAIPSVASSVAAPTKEGLEKVADLSFYHGFVSTLAVILVSELGDKTFFIAAILAMRHSRKVVLGGALSALGIMHVGSSFFGFVFAMIPRLWVLYVSSLLFALFGLKMLRDGIYMSDAEAREEMDEVQEDIKKREEVDVESQTSGSSLYSVFMQSFTMTFLAEWGDRSQLATVILAARENLVAVIVAGLIGHGLCTGLAVLGGRFIAQKISVRTVTLVGGVVFLFFSVSTLFLDSYSP